MSPDALRMQPQAVAFVKSFFDTDKPIAGICHGPWTVIEGGAARGYRMTSWPSLKTDIKNAGADWVDQEVVVDDNLITSRKPDDLPAFNREMLSVFGQYQPQGSRSPRTGGVAQRPGCPIEINCDRAGRRRGHITRDWLRRSHACRHAARPREP